MRKSGATEEFAEREQLLTDIKNRADDWNTTTKSNKALEQAKAKGIEKSGEVVRRLAIEGSTDDGGSDSEQSDSERTSAKRRKITKRDKLKGLMSAIQGAISDSAQHTTEKLKIERERLEFDKSQALRQAEDSQRLFQESERRLNNDQKMFDFVLQMGKIMSKLADQLDSMQLNKFHSRFEVDRSS
jgi:hypothetical protein